MTKNKLCYIVAVINNEGRFVGFITADTRFEMNNKASKLGVKQYGKIFGYIKNDDPNKSRICERGSRDTNEIIGGDW